MSETSAPPVSIVEFLTARYDAREELLRMMAEPGRHYAAEARRGLADIAAKRAIIARCTDAQDAAQSVAETYADDESSRARVERAGYSQAANALRGVLRDLASAYSDHPDYREEWRP